MSNVNLPLNMENVVEINRERREKEGAYVPSGVLIIVSSLHCAFPYFEKNRGVGCFMYTNLYE